MTCLNATSETLAVHGGAHRPLPVRANISLGAGNDGLTGGICQPVHNFSNDNANGPRIVCVGIGGGIALPFIFQSFHRQDI